MEKQTTKEFKRELYKLFDARVHWIVKSIGSRKVGTPPKFNRKKVSKAISKLQTIASKSIVDALAKMNLMSLLK